MPHTSHYIVIHLGYIQTAQPKIVPTAPIEIIKWIPHTSRLCAPQLCVHRLQLLQLCIQRRGLTSKRNKCCMLCLEGRRDS